MSDGKIDIRRGGRLFLISAIVLVVLFLVGRGVAEFYTEILWYRSVGYEGVFWTRTLVDLGVRIAAGGITALLAFLSFRIVARTLSGVQIKRRFGNLEIADIENAEPKQFERLVRRALADGTHGNGRGFVLMPSACPYGRKLSERTVQNYETMVRCAEDF